MQIFPNMKTWSTPLIMKETNKNEILFLPYHWQKLRLAIVLARIFKKEYLRIIPFKEDKSTIIECISKNYLKQ